MRSEIDVPPVPDTPEMFSKIEANLMQEAARIKARHAARQRRTRWYDNLGPALAAGAAFAAMALMFPLAIDTSNAGGGAPASSIEHTIGESTESADPAMAPALHLRRLPAEDRTATERTQVAAEDEPGAADGVEDTTEPAIQGRVS